MENHLGKNLKFLRKVRKQTQQQLANAVFVGRSAVSHWEDQRSMPDVLQCRRLVTHFGIISIEQLCFEDIEKETVKRNEKNLSNS